MNEPKSTLWMMWLKKGDDDAVDAERLFADADMPRSIVCFHCQQAVEKWLKALIVYQGGDPPRTHDLLLLASCVSVDENTRRTIQECALDFMAYAVELRYPGDYEATDTEATQAIHQMRAVSAVIHAMLEGRR